MPAAARMSDSVAGITGGDYSDHIPPHGPLPFTGNISGNCSADVMINGQSAAYVGSTTTESDSCCGAGSISASSSTVYINGHPAARQGDALCPHSGTGSITGGSGDVEIGG